MSRKQEGNTVIQVEVEKELGLKMRNCAKAKGLTRERFYRECLLDGFNSRKVSDVEKIAMEEVKKFAKAKKMMKAIKAKDAEKEKDKDITELLKAIKELAKVINGI